MTETLTNSWNSQEIETQKLFMQKMQRDFYTNICKRSQQNEEIITFNTRLSKVDSQTPYSKPILLLEALFACLLSFTHAS